ncbi:MAG: hypothetical protein N4A64_04620 [Marinisporobacter sp.]|jgi:hypothetical protein|nr:hypothetical protein [Marinisporobacter sp.]
MLEYRVENNLIYMKMNGDNWTTDNMVGHDEIIELISNTNIIQTNEELTISIKIKKIKISKDKQSLLYDDIIYSELTELNCFINDSSPLIIPTENGTATLTFVSESKGEFNICVDDGDKRYDALTITVIE